MSQNYCAVLIGLLLIGGCLPLGALTPFEELCARGSVEQVSEALRLGANPNEHSRDEFSPLMLAVKYNKKHPLVVDTLLKNGAMVDEKVNGLTALHIAASDNSDPQVVSALLAAGADVHEQDFEGNPPLHRAAGRNPNPSILSILLKNGAKTDQVDREGYSALIRASASNPNVAVIEVLLEAGAEVNYREPADGATALMVAAAENPNPEVVYTLIKYGADPKMKNRYGATAYDYANDNRAWMPSDRVFKVLSEALK